MVANCVVLVPAEAVGAAGVPVNVGDAKLTLKAPKESAVKPVPTFIPPNVIELATGKV